MSKTPKTTVVVDSSVKEDKEEAVHKKEQVNNVVTKTEVKPANEISTNVLKPASEILENVQKDVTQVIEESLKKVVTIYTDPSQGSGFLINIRVMF